MNYLINCILILFLTTNLSFRLFRQKTNILQTSEYLCSADYSCLLRVSRLNSKNKNVKEDNYVGSRKKMDAINSRGKLKKECVPRVQ